MTRPTLSPPRPTLATTLGLGLALGAVAAAALAPRAAAECAMRTSRITPPTGATLPPAPTLYVFAAPDDDSRITAVAAGQPLQVHVDEVGASDAWVVRRVRIDTLRAGPIAVHYSDHARGDDGGTASYLIEPDAPPDRAALIATEPVDYAWTCSFTHAVAFDVQGTAIAYRLEWADAIDDLRRGVTARAYLWPRPTAPGELGVDHAYEQVLVGHQSCLGWDVPEAAFGHGAFVRLVALFADGREKGADLGVLTIDQRELRPPDWYDGPLGLDADPAPLVTPAPRPTPPPASLAALVGAAAAGSLVTALVALLVARPRRRARGLGILADLEPADPSPSPPR